MTRRDISAESERADERAWERSQVDDDGHTDSDRSESVRTEALAHTRTAWPGLGPEDAVRAARLVRHEPTLGHPEVLRALWGAHMQREHTRTLGHLRWVRPRDVLAAQRCGARVTAAQCREHLVTRIRLARVAPPLPLPGGAS